MGAEPLIAQAGLAAMLLTISDTRSLKSQSLWVCQWPLTGLIQVRDATRSQKTNSWTGKMPAAGYWWNRPIDYHQKIPTSTTTVNLSSATMVDLAHDKCHPSQNVRIPTRAICQLFDPYHDIQSCKSIGRFILRSVTHYVHFTTLASLPTYLLAVLLLQKQNTNKQKTCPKSFNQTNENLAHILPFMFRCTIFITRNVYFY